MIFWYEINLVMRECVFLLKRSNAFFILVLLTFFKIFSLWFFKIFFEVYQGLFKRGPSKESFNSLIVFHQAAFRNCLEYSHNLYITKITMREVIGFLHSTVNILFGAYITIKHFQCNRCMKQVLETWLGLVSWKYYWISGDLKERSPFQFSVKILVKQRKLIRNYRCSFFEKNLKSLTWWPTAAS